MKKKPNKESVASMLSRMKTCGLVEFKVLLELVKEAKAGQPGKRK